jgi:uncharacterized surface protein with fasciclin (FAS1) repeats
MSNIMQVIREQKSLSTLNRGVLASGLDNVLLGKGPFTLFAPTNVAFEKLERSTVENLLERENKSLLSAIMSKHVVRGKLNYRDLKDGETLKTLSGKELSVKVKDGQVSIDGADIKNRDLNVSNGIVHSLDTVLQDQFVII